MIIEYRIFIFIVDKSLKLTAFMIAAYSPHGKRGLLRMQTDSLGRTFYRKRGCVISLWRTLFFYRQAIHLTLINGN